jgi:hypothetical protein
MMLATAVRTDVDDAPKELVGSPQDIASLWTQINLQEPEENSDEEWELFDDESSDDEEYDEW